MPQRDRPRRERRAKVGEEGPQSGGVTEPNSMQKFNELARRLVNVPREELLREEEQYKIENATRRRRRNEEGPNMQGRKVSVILPTGEQGEGTEVEVDHSSERWSEFTLSDGTILRAKMTLLTSVRVDGHFDPLGNPFYSTSFAPVMTIVSVPEQLRKKAQ
jgi:hypothetical protein